MADEKDNAYVPFNQRVADVKEEVHKQAFKKKEKPKLGMSEDQVRWAEKTVSLMKMPEFEEYRQFEATMQANALRHAFMQRSGKDGNKTFGEDMSYNEGFYHGLLAMKSERERIWLSYLKTLKNNKEGETE